MNYLEDSQAALAAASVTQEALRKLFSETAELSAFAIQALATAFLENQAKKNIDKGMEISQGGETLLDRKTNTLTADHMDLITKLMDTPVGTKVEGAENFDFKLYGQKIIQTDDQGVVTHNFWNSKKALEDPTIQKQKSDFKSMLASLRPEQEVNLSQEARIDVPTGAGTEKVTDESWVDNDHPIQGEYTDEYDDIDFNDEEYELWRDESLAAEAAVVSTTNGEYDDNVDLAEFGISSDVEDKIQATLIQKNAARESNDYYQVEEQEKLETKADFDAEISSTNLLPEDDLEEDDEIIVEFYNRDPISESGQDSVVNTLENLPKTASVGVFLDLVKKADTDVNKSPDQELAARQAQSNSFTSLKLTNTYSLEDTDLIATMQGIKNLSAVLMDPDDKELITEGYRIERLEENGITEYKVFDLENTTEPVLNFSDTGLVLSASKQTEEPAREISLRVNVGQAQESIKKREEIISEFKPKDDGAIERYQTFTGMVGVMQEQEFASKRTTGLKGDGKIEVSIEGNGSMYIKETVSGEKKNILEMDQKGDILKMSMSTKEMKNATATLVVPLVSATPQEEEEKEQKRPASRRR